MGGKRNGRVFLLKRPGFFKRDDGKAVGGETEITLLFSYPYYRMMGKKKQWEEKRQGILFYRGQCFFLIRACHAIQPPEKGDCTERCIPESG